MDSKQALEIYQAAYVRKEADDGIAFKDNQSPYKPGLLTKMFMKKGVKSPAQLAAPITRQQVQASLQ